MRLITWNSQGETWGGIEWRLDKYAPDIMVVQECGNLGTHFGFGPGEDGQALHIADYGEYRVFWTDWSRVGAGSTNPRCSLAMIYKDSGGPAVWASDVDTKRPIMAKTINTYWYVCNIHAGGRDYIEEVCSRVKSNSGEKCGVVVGDFNQQPGDVDAMAANYGLRPVNAGKATRPRSGRELDFALTAGSGTAELLVDYGGSDHISVVMDLSR